MRLGRLGSLATPWFLSLCNRCRKVISLEGPPPAHTIVSEATTYYVKNLHLLQKVAPPIQFLPRLEHMTQMVNGFFTLLEIFGLTFSHPNSPVS